MYFTQQIELTLTIASTSIMMLIAIWKFVWQIRDRKSQKLTARRSVRKPKSAIGVERFPKQVGKPKAKRASVDPKKPPVSVSDSDKVRID